MRDKLHVTAQQVPESVIVQFYDAMDEEGDDEMEIHELVHFLQHGPAIVHYRQQHKAERQHRVKKDHRLRASRDQSRSASRTSRAPSVPAANAPALPPPPMPSSSELAELLSREGSVPSGRCREVELPPNDVQAVIMAVARSAARLNRRDDKALIMRALSLIPLVSQLPASRIRRLTKLATVRTVLQGTAVYSSASHPDEVLVLLGGQIWLQWPEPQTIELELGMPVSHPTRGAGVVSAIDTTAPKPFTIKFDAADEHSYNDTSMRKFLTMGEGLRAPAFFGALGLHHCAARGHEATAAHGEARILALPTDSVVHEQLNHHASRAQAAARRRMWSLQPWAYASPCATLKVLVEITELRCYADSETIVRQKEPCEELLLVRSGRVRLRSSVATRSDVVVDYDELADVEDFQDFGVIDVLTAPCLIADTHAAPTVRQLEGSSNGRCWPQAHGSNGRCWLYTIEAMGAVDLVAMPRAVLGNAEALDAHKIELLVPGSPVGSDLAARHSALFGESVVICPVDASVFAVEPSKAVLTCVLFPGLGQRKPKSKPQPYPSRRIWRPCYGELPDGGSFDDSDSDTDEDVTQRTELEQRLAYLGGPTEVSAVLWPGMLATAQARRTDGIRPAEGPANGATTEGSTVNTGEGSPVGLASQGIEAKVLTQAQVGYSDTVQMADIKRTAGLGDMHKQTTETIAADVSAIGSPTASTVEEKAQGSPTASTIDRPALGPPTPAFGLHASPLLSE